MDRKAWTRWPDWVNLVAGIYLFIVPWIYSTTSETAASWDLWIFGIVIGAVALWALSAPLSAAAEWAQVVFGGWVFISPWVLGFAGLAAPAWSAWIVGAVVVILAGSALAQMSSTTGIGRSAQTQAPHSV